MLKLPVVALVLAIVVVAASLIAATRLYRRRFSLGWLMMVVAMVSVVLGGVLWWRDYGRARVERVDPASVAWGALRPEAVIAQRAVHSASPRDSASQREFTVRYVPRHRSVGELVDLPEVDAARASARDESSGSFGVTYYHDVQQVDYESSSRAELEAVLAAVRAADVLRPEQGESVIFGIVVDGDGTPVAGATVDLQGPFVYVNHFRTRDDGTFFMPITAPAGRGYYLRIRQGAGKEVLTRAFRHDGPGAELGLRVTVD